MDDPGTPRAVLALVVGGRHLVLEAFRAEAAPGDLALIDALLRTHLALDRCGVSLRLQEAHPELRELLELAGVAERLGLGLGLERRGGPAPPAAGPGAG